MWVTGLNTSTLVPQGLWPAATFKDGLVGMEVTHHIGTPKLRRVNALVDCLANIHFNAHNSNLQNSLRAVLERVFYVKDGKGGFTRPPQPVRGLRRQLIKFECRFSKGIPMYITRWTRQQFVDAYVGQRKVLYERAAQSLLHTPLRKKDAYVSAFVKTEKTDITSKVDPVPRLIQPRSPRFNVELGCYLKPIEHKVYDIIAAVFGSPTVFKGMNAIQQGKLMHAKWSRFRNPVAIGLDASRFDQHCSREILRWEHSIYRKFYPRSSRLRELLEAQIHNRGYINNVDGTIKYQTVGCRMSGDMNTGLGNCLIMCALIYSYFGDFREYELVNNGDDCVVIMDKKHLDTMQGIPNFFDAMGYTMVVEEPVYVLERVVFCQSQPIYDGKIWRMMRNPKTCLSKDLISVKSLDSIKAWKAQMQAISDCGKALAGDIPIFCKFYKMLDMNVKAATQGAQIESGLQWLSRGMSNVFAEPTTKARFSFWKAFGILPDHQIAIESAYEEFDIVYAPGPVRNLTTQIKI